MTNPRTLFFKNKIKRMTELNQNFLGVIVGPTGSGKTYSALQIADEMMDGLFDINIHLVMTFKEFMSRLHKFKKGDVIVFEEAGVNISAKNWQSKANKNMGLVMQTCRHRNFGIIFTLPMFEFMDKTAREHIHTLFMTHTIDRSKDIAWLKVYDFKIDSYKGKEPYRIIPKFWIDNTLISMPLMAVRLPRKELIDGYEIKKTKFTKELYERINKEIENEELQDNKKLNKGAPCPLCALSSWEFRKKEKYWLCRKCGFENFINPYSVIKEEDKDDANKN